MTDQANPVISAQAAIDQGLTPAQLTSVATWSYNEADAEYKKHPKDKTRDIPRAKRLKAQAKLVRETVREMYNILNPEEPTDDESGEFAKAMEK